MTFSRFISHLHTGEVLISQVNYRKWQRQKSCMESPGLERGWMGTWGASYPSLEARGEGLLSVTEDIGGLLMDSLNE